jgi:hypothetical protein
MSNRMRTSIAFGVVALTAAIATSPVSGNGFVVAGKSIGGVSLGQTLEKVHKKRPLGRKKPAQKSTQILPVVGKAKYETWTDKTGSSMFIGYTRAKKKKPYKVVYISSGPGFWTDLDHGLTYSTTTGFGDSPSEVAKQFPCSFYSKTPSGVRLYDPAPGEGDGQFCEVIFSQTSYFYLSFNVGGITPDIPARLVGFALSKFQIP